MTCEIGDSHPFEGHVVSGVTLPDLGRNEEQPAASASADSTCRGSGE